MSILDKKLYLADLSEQLDAFLSGAQARRVLEAAGLALHYCFACGRKLEDD